MGPDVVVFGQLARDLVLVVDQVPGPGESGKVRLRREMLGGKGANQAVALAQLGLRPALVAVAGDDAIAPDLLAQAEVDGIDVSAVVRRPGTSTALIAGLARGCDKERTARLAVAAAGATVTHPGGRPSLTGISA